MGVLVENWEILSAILGACIAIAVGLRDESQSLVKLMWIYPALIVTFLLTWGIVWLIRDVGGLSEKAIVVSVGLTTVICVAVARFFPKSWLEKKCLEIKWVSSLIAVVFCSLSIATVYCVLSISQNVVVFIDSSISLDKTDKTLQVVKDLEGKDGGELFGPRYEIYGWKQRWVLMPYTDVVEFKSGTATGPRWKFELESGRAGYLVLKQLKPYSFGYRTDIEAGH